MTGTRRADDGDEDPYVRNARLLDVQRTARRTARRLRVVGGVFVVAFVAGALLWWLSA